MKTCTWTNCQNVVYGKHEFCYYHRKLMTGKMTLEDRVVYMPNKIEQNFARETDNNAGIEVRKMHGVLNTPVSAEIIKLSSHLLWKKTGQSSKNFASDIAIMLMLHLSMPDKIENFEDFVKKQSTKIVGKLLNQYKKETDYQKYEVPLDSVSDRLLSSDPESIIIKEQEEATLYRAIYYAKRKMTKIERKIFTLLERGNDEIFIGNKLKLSKQRVNALKHKAFSKVKKFLDG